MTLRTLFDASVVCAFMTLFAACGGDDATPAVDGGSDATVDAQVVCATNADCRNSFYCDGPEVCAPGAAGANAYGCVEGAPPCASGETCVEGTDSCRPCSSADADGDGTSECDGDCDDADGSRYPGATEMCDGDDEDCDNTTFGLDYDHDGFESSACCNGPGNCGPDCDDTLNTVNPGAAEQCNGGIDDDCDGLADAAEGVCVACPSGYEGFDGACADIDECVVLAPCGGASGTTCTNTPGAYQCTCPVGYAAAATGGTCSDINECATGTPCGITATSCTNTLGSYVCACAPGYAAPAVGGACADVNLCAELAPCGGAVGAYCTNTPGSYVCTCPTGYAALASGGTCVDNDECATGSPCGSEANLCTNTPGSYVCACRPGYAAPSTGGSCADVNECDVASTCGTGRTNCTNTPGSYVCACAAGYAAPAMGGGCIDIDECVTGACGAGMASCTNLVGSYACLCAAGYTAPVSGAPCADVDECAAGTPCGAGLGTCANRSGSYACTCIGGYGAPAAGGACTEVNECTTGTDDCDRDPLAACTNTAGSYGCACPPVFVGTGHGTSGCLLSDPALASLVPAAGTLSPLFAPATTFYTLALPPGTTDTTLTPSVAYPTHAVIRVNGVVVASGASSLPITPSGFGPATVTVTVTPESGAARTYTIVVGRGSTFIKASNTQVDDMFGVVVALSTDGSTLAVGAMREGSNATGIDGDQANESALDSGAVYVFTRVGATWSQQAYVKASNTNAGDRFGSSIALSADGSTLAVGSVAESSNATGINGDQANNATTLAGAVYIFARTLGVWSQQAYLKASNTGAGDSFGYAVALAADGSTLAVGAYGERSGATGIDGNQADNSAYYSGAAYIFTRLGTAWSQQAYIKASTAEYEDYFAGAIALSADGATLAVGASGEDSNASGIGGDQTNNATSGAGAVYVFTRTLSVWSQQAYIKASNPDSGDVFGGVLALSGDGSTLAVSTPNECSSATGVGGNQTNNSSFLSGAAYVFTRVGTTWSQQAYIKASNTDAEDRFGTAITLSVDGNTLAVGAPQERSLARGIGGDQSINSAPFAGAVYVFARAGTAWSQHAYVKASNANINQAFGIGVALSGDGSTLAVGAYQESSNATGVGGDQTNTAARASGAAYVF